MGLMFTTLKGQFYLKGVPNTACAFSNIGPVHVTQILMCKLILSLGQKLAAFRANLIVDLRFSLCCSLRGAAQRTS